MLKRRVLILLALAACAPGDDASAQRGGSDSVVQAAVAREMSRIRARADSVDAVFQPLPFLRPASEAALRRFDNEAQLVAARRLGIQPNIPRAEMERLARAGRLVRLADTTDLWVIRRLDHSSPYLTADAEALLRELAQRFQSALAKAGLPAYRLEVTSVLRTADDQAALRAVNPNAAAGESTHQYATTFDVAYSAFAPPLKPIVEPSLPEAAWLEDHLTWVSSTLAELVAARRSRELMAILGGTLIEMQREGKVLVTLERLQPVYHMTIARAAGR